MRTWIQFDLFQQAVQKIQIMSIGCRQIQSLLPSFDHMEVDQKYVVSAAHVEGEVHRLEDQRKVGSLPFLCPEGPTPKTTYMHYHIKPI